MLQPQPARATLQGRGCGWSSQRWQKAETQRDLSGTVAGGVPQPLGGQGALRAGPAQRGRGAPAHWFYPEDRYKAGNESMHPCGHTRLWAHVKAQAAMLCSAGKRTRDPCVILLLPFCMGCDCQMEQSLLTRQAKGNSESPNRLKYKWHTCCSGVPANSQAQTFNLAVGHSSSSWAKQGILAVCICKADT